MRRLVAISNKTSKILMTLVALAILLTSIHMAAAARITALKRQELAISSQPAVAGMQQPAPSQTSAAGLNLGNQSLGNQIGSANQVAIAKAVQEQAGSASSAVVPVRKRQIVISIADRKLAVLEDGQLLKTYPIAVGTRHTPSPDGDFVIINRARNPIYRHGDKEIAPGKDNPLGTRWMGLSMKGYGIHGTNVQSSVGKAASHGCFRMRKEDVEELYTLIQVGDTVTVRRERDAMIAQMFAAPPAPVAMMEARAQSTEIQVASAATTIETNEQ